MKTDELKKLVEKLIDLHQQQLDITTVNDDQLSEWNELCTEARKTEKEINEIFNPRKQLWQLP